MASESAEIVAVDRGHAVPLYHQIFLQLREEITSGERAFGSRMPTEQELSAQFGVSRITALRALDELAENHLVERKRRVGTTVVFQSPVKPIQGNIEQALDSGKYFKTGEGLLHEVIRADSGTKKLFCRLLVAADHDHRNVTGVRVAP